MVDTRKIALPSVRAYPSTEKLSAAWGVDIAGIYSLTHFSNAGWCALELPPMVEVYVWAAKAARHKEAVPLLFTLARVGIYSQLTLSEALTLARELRDMSPLMTGDQMSNTWAEYGIQAVTVWESRRSKGGVGVGDEWRALFEVKALIQGMNARRLSILEAKVASLRARGGTHQAPATYAREQSRK